MMLLPQPLFNRVQGVLARAFRHGEEKRGIQIGKKEVSLSLSTNGMILYRENPKDSTKKLLEVINLAKLQDMQILVDLQKERDSHLQQNSVCLIYLCSDT
jgi:hypothetical protein